MITFIEKEKWGAPLEQRQENTADFMTPCPFPQCEMCKQYIKGVCTTPIVITKQNWRILTEKIDALEKLAVETEKALYDEILGVEEPKEISLEPKEILFKWGNEQ